MKILILPILFIYYIISVKIESIGYLGLTTDIDYKTLSELTSNIYEINTATATNPFEIAEVFEEYGSSNTYFIFINLHKLRKLDIQCSLIQEQADINGLIIWNIDNTVTDNCYSRLITSSIFRSYQHRKNINYT